MPTQPHWSWPNDFSKLAPEMYTKLRPSGLPDPHWVALSTSCAQLIGLDPAIEGDPAWARILVGSDLLEGSAPLASVYSGHQFGVWAGQLGDGRALMLGEIETQAGARFELQLKGAGRTPYSRGADGRAVLRSSIREFLASEAMHALGIPSTRALSIIASDQPVIRETVETAAVVCRVAPSFVRFGHFEHFYYGQDHQRLHELFDFVLNKYFPEIAQRHPDRRADQGVDVLIELCQRTARMIAAWQSVGFCHGVMNTDNMSILGLTMDYGPFGFLDAFQMNHLCNHTDQQGRYAYAMQPRIGEWNCYCLAQALMPIIGDVERIKSAMPSYQIAFASELNRLMYAKLGLCRPEHEPSQLVEDQALFDDLFKRLDANRVDMTRFFRAMSEENRLSSGRDLFIDRSSFEAWFDVYQQRWAKEGLDQSTTKMKQMRQVNPKFVLRNHLAETAIRQAQGGDFREISRLNQVLASPFEEHAEHEDLAALPPDWASQLEVSCSS
jgi:serine/tyrosine/threonine adenylyltransferase